MTEPQRMQTRWEAARVKHKQTRELLELFARIPDIDQEGAEELLRRAWQSAYRDGFQGGELSAWAETVGSGRHGTVESA